MVHFLIRRRTDEEPLALFRFNAKERGNLTIAGVTFHGRFAPYAHIHRSNRHVFNLMLQGHDEVAAALAGVSDYRLEEVSRAEWESFDAFDLFPVLKVGLASPEVRRIGFRPDPKIRRRGW